MRYIVSLVTALAGMTMGLVLALILNGLPTTGEIFRWGFGGAAVALLSQFAFLNISETHGPVDYSPKQKKPIQRTESQGSFSERMDRFAQNVDAAPIDPDKKPKAEFWVDPDLDEYEPTPPKPIGVIRMLLHRIRRILSGR